MNEPAFLKPGNDLDIPAGFVVHPRQEGSRVARIAHRRGGHRADAIGPMHLHRFVKPLERAQSGRHRFRRDDAVFENAAAQARHLAILMHDAQTMLHHAADLQPAGVRSDVDGGKSLHDLRRLS
jgi:hypothetical protein